MGSSSAKRCAISLAAATLGLAAFTGVAGAATTDETGMDIPRAQEIASAFWSGAPCGGNITVSSVPLQGVYGYANWANPGGAGGNPAANSNCVVTLNSDAGMDWPTLCTMMVHEYGHLLGHQHSTDPANVMYVEYVGPIAECGQPEVLAAQMPARPAKKHRRHGRHSSPIRAAVVGAIKRMRATHQRVA